MSGYLSRLVSRTREAGEMQSLQPIVRSTSPIAERDQRIGMTGFEGIEFGEPSIADVGSETADLKQGDALQPSAPPPVTRVNGRSDVTVQRKVANPAAASTSPTVRATPSIATAVHARTMHEHLAVSPGLSQNDTPLAPEAPKLTPQNRPLTSSAKEDTEAATPAETLHDSVRPLASPLANQPTANQAQTPTVERSASIAARKNVAVDRQEAISSTKAIPAEISNADPARPDGPPRQVNPVHVRSAWQSHQADTRYLEPSPRHIAEHLGSTEDTDTPLSGVDESPRVVIGRVNVEVVPPPVTQASTAQRPGPLTAASVSVIGPLGGNLRSHWGLGLRYR